MRLFWTILVITLISGCGQNGTSWNQEKLEEAIGYCEEIGTFALVVQTDNRIVGSYGDIDSLSRVHSIRKAILMALVSQHLDKIDLNATLEELNIDDSPIPLTELQRSAKVIHLLRSTSGINHPTVSQVGNAQLMRDSLLGKEPNIPGTKWAYNNWDYNTLTTIFEQLSGQTVEEAFKEGIAKPLQIERFETLIRKDTALSMHGKVGFRLSTRDMAKFGQLFLNEGEWDGREIIPRSWVERITKDYEVNPVPKTERYAQGYLWWIPAESYAGGLPKGSYLTTGTAGQRILVVPAWNTVIAHKTMTEIPSRERTPVSSGEFEELVRRISEARLQ